MNPEKEARRIIKRSDYSAMSFPAAIRGVKKLVTHPEVNECQICALACLLMNIGARRFRDSQVLKLTNKGQFIIAASHFMEYVFDGDEEVKRFRERREAERRLYTTPTLVSNKGKTMETV